MNFFATITDKNYLFKTLTLIETLKNNVFILCQDQESYDFLKQNFNQKKEIINLISLKEIKNINELKRKSLNRSHREFSVSLKPFLVDHILRNREDVQKLIFLDSDTFFFNYNEVELFGLIENDIIISSHNYSEKNKKKKIYGDANAGIIGFKNNNNAKLITNWWKEQCFYKCTEIVSEKYYLDQKYLDQIPKKLGTVGKFDFNVNVAPWNIANFNLGFKEDIFYVNEKKLSMYHFQNLQYLIRNYYYCAFSEYGIKKNHQVLLKIYSEYLSKLNVNLNRTLSLIDKQKLRINFKLLIKSLLFSDYLSIK